eukprot:m.176266 g.176266  ORF g.176266 m.176266 type:complete len:56 (+) comp31844_c1_seq1:31-198(+)
MIHTVFTTSNVFTISFESKSDFSAVVTFRRKFCGDINLQLEFSLCTTSVVKLRMR